MKCYFEWETDYKDARQEVINRLQFVQLPTGLQAQLSPWNAIGEVFRYRVVGKGYTLKDLKTAEDWILERQFKQVPGVIDVTSFGGETKQYHVEVDPYRLRGHNVTLAQLTGAIQNANQNVGGQRLVHRRAGYDVRGIGLWVRGPPPSTTSRTSSSPRRRGRRSASGTSPTSTSATRRASASSATTSEPDVVQGIVLMRYGGETQPTLEGIHAQVDYIRQNHLLPPGMDIVPYYDRGNLVEVTTHTVLENLLVGMVLVTIVLLLFLGHARAALITAINIPLALLIAFCGLVATGTSANLISLGAVDFGIVVDSTVIMMENIFRHLGPHGKGTMTERIQQARARWRRR